MSALHITNGDSAASTLKTFVSDPVTVTADVLHEGPAPAGLEGAAWHDCRARYLASTGYTGVEDARRQLTEWDQAIASASRYDEVVLWFEHDLFDQLLLIRTLDLLVQLELDATRVSLICIDRFPGVERFVGLGQLSPEQLATLVHTRISVTHEQDALATEAWHAFRSADPTSLVDLTTRSAALPFLGVALERFFEEYPSTVNGLPRTANAILRAVDPAPLDGLTLFLATQAAEGRPFMGDSSFFFVVKRLAASRVPLLAIEPCGDAADLRGHVVRITDAGRAVLSGAQDALTLNGIDEWRGGVHLVGTASSPWRWDPGAETLVS